MLDNLRDQASFQEEEPLQPTKKTKTPRQRKQSRSFDQTTRMSARQRFALALMLLIIVILLGILFLVVTGKVVLPFMI
jgi:hypothetical protein